MREASELEQRAAVEREARAWLGAAYHHMARVRPDPARGERGACDCATLLCEVYHGAGLIPRVELEYYPVDWNLHRDVERYLNRVREYARPGTTPGIGDLALYRYGRTLSHGAIVVSPGWPHIIHALMNVGVTEDNGENSDLGRRERHFFTLW